MQRTAGRRCWVALLILFAPVRPAMPQERQVTIPFNLPNGLSFEEQGDHVQEINFPGRQPEITRRQSAGRFTVRVTSEGYTVVQRPGGAPAPPPADLTGMMNAVVANAILSWDLDKRGRLLRVRGYEALMEQLTQEMGKAMKDVARAGGVSPSVSSSELINRMLTPMGIHNGDPSPYLMQQWNNRQILGFHAGETFPVGKMLHAEEHVPIPSGGSISVTRVSKINETTCGSRKCLEIIQVSSSDSSAGPALTQMVRGMLGGMLSGLGRGGLMPAELGYEDAKITTDVARSIEVETGLILQDINTREITCTLVTPDGRSPVTLKTKSTYRYVRRQP